MPAPPLGWNSFDCYGCYLHGQAAPAHLEATGGKLRPYGYEYLVIDNGWFGEYGFRPGTNLPLQKHAEDVRLNEFGQVLPSKAYVPNGLEPVIKRAHGLNIKVGVHLMRGIPRKTCGLDLPIGGTDHTARDIADTREGVNCNWRTYNYAVDMSKPGANPLRITGDAWDEGKDLDECFNAWKKWHQSWPTGRAGLLAGPGHDSVRQPADDGPARRGPDRQARQVGDPPGGQGRENLKDAASATTR